MPPSSSARAGRRAPGRAAPAPGRRKAGAAAPPRLPRPPAQGLGGFLAGAACAGVGARLLLARAARARGSVEDLLLRGGALSSGRRAGGDVARDDASVRGALGRVNMVKIEGPSEAEVLAARRRRARQLSEDGGEDGGGRPAVGMDALAIPEGHPFATREAVGPEDAELLRRRLRITRGAPLQDLDGTRGYGDGDDEQYGGGGAAGS